MTAPAPTVAVLDYGSGNVHSAVKALVRAGADASLTRDPETVLTADGLLVPGVGAFDAVIRALRAVGGDRLIAERLAEGRPALGICVGEQVMFARGIERGVESDGLGYWPGTVRELRAPVLPHMGWSPVDPPAESRLFRGVERERFYFVHSNAAPEWAVDSGPSAAPRITWAEHGERFVAAVEDGPLSATQFHPEKSGAAGIRLLGNWIESLRTTPSESE